MYCSVVVVTFRDCWLPLLGLSCVLVNLSIIFIMSCIILLVCSVADSREEILLSMVPSKVEVMLEVEEILVPTCGVRTAGVITLPGPVLCVGVDCLAASSNQS